MQASQRGGPTTLSAFQCPQHASQILPHCSPTEPTTVPKALTSCSAEMKPTSWVSTLDPPLLSPRFLCLSDLCHLSVSGGSGPFPYSQTQNPPPWGLLIPTPPGSSHHHRALVFPSQQPHSDLHLNTALLPRTGLAFSSKPSAREVLNKLQGCVLVTPFQKMCVSENYKSSTCFLEKPPNT